MPDMDVMDKSTKRGEDGLTAMQRRFCDAYVIEQNATKAAIRAGYNEHSAYSQGSRLLKTANVSAYLKKFFSEVDNSLHLEAIASAQEVLQNLTAVMRRQTKESVVLRVHAEDSRINDKGKREVIKTTETKIVEVPASITQSLKAAEMLGRYLSLFGADSPAGGEIEDLRPLADMLAPGADQDGADDASDE